MLGQRHSFFLFSAGHIIYIVDGSVGTQQEFVESRPNIAVAITSLPGNSEHIRLPTEDSAESFHGIDVVVRKCISFQLLLLYVITEYFQKESTPVEVCVGYASPISISCKAFASLGTYSLCDLGSRKSPQEQKMTRDAA